MTLSIDSMKSMTLPALKKYAKALREKIKAGGGRTSTDQGVQDFVKELDLVKSVIADKEIAEADMTAIKNLVADTLKKDKP